mmetsp:Transcript_36710/g.69084  ORF Transcript_36710/g.69084 Transcript_36710/m.69084 type:complete len:217 (+) Transcript_36710:605-1255(+)
MRDGLRGRRLNLRFCGRTQTAAVVAWPTSSQHLGRCRHLGQGGFQYARLGRAALARLLGLGRDTLARCPARSVPRFGSSGSCHRSGARPSLALERRRFGRLLRNGGGRARAVRVRGFPSCVNLGSGKRPRNRLARGRPGGRHCGADPRGGADAGSGRARWGVARVHNHLHAHVGSVLRAPAGALRKLLHLQRSRPELHCFGRLGSAPSLAHALAQH